jgi:hypothetical protein
MSKALGQRWDHFLRVLFVESTLHFRFPTSFRIPKNASMALILTLC